MQTTIAALKEGQARPDGQLHFVTRIRDRAPYGMASGRSSWDEAMADQARDITLPGRR